MEVGDLVKVHDQGQTFVGLITKMVQWSAHSPVFNRWAVLYKGQEWIFPAIDLEVISEGR